MAPELYQPLFLAVTGIATYLYAAWYASSSSSGLGRQRFSMAVSLISSLILVFWLGGRPVSGRAFGDTVNYALEYMAMDAANRSVSMNWNAEWIWSLLMVTCKRAGISISGFFTIVEAGYVLSLLWAVKRFMPSNPLLGMLFAFTSLMFFTFGVNGLRNGLACHIVLVAMSYFFDDKYLPAILFSLLSFGIHRSTILPVAAMLAGRYAIKDYRYAIGIWGASILVSLAAGGAFSGFFAMLGFDERMSSYLTSEYADSFSRTGFRWDFLLYSSLPVLMGWYVCVKKAIRDDWYRALCTAYCLCNAFWVIVIRAAFSNRFAYLSWFMYPLVIAYPLINLPVWEDQERKTGLILAAYCSFTLFMQVFVW